MNFISKNLFTIFLSFYTLSVYSQDLTISSSGQTGTSGTNWIASGSNPVRISSTSTSNINSSVIQGYINSGVDVIISSVGNIIINDNISKTTSGNLILKSKGNSISGSGSVTLGNNTQLLISSGCIISNNIILSSGTATIGFAPVEVEFLLVGGGGGGSSGGGGGGGVIYQSASLISGTSYAVTVGAGGQGQKPNTANGSNGGATIFNSVTANGGGGGGKVQAAGVSGSSGGGAGADCILAGGSATQGYPGGDGPSTAAGTGASGGGGAGSAGVSGYTKTAYNTLYGLPSTQQNTMGGNGGNGIVNTITGSSIYYGGGGGGGCNNNNGTQPIARAGQGGLGGGGTGANGDVISGFSGTANTGGGGGGGDWEAALGGNGGSGIAIIRHMEIGSISGGTSSAGSGLAAGYTIHTFTSNGTFTIAPGSLEISGIISGAGNITYTSNGGTITLSGNNTYIGNTNISGGTLALNTTGSLGSGNYIGDVSNSGILRFRSSSNQTFSGIFSGSGQLIKETSTSTLKLTGNNTYSGTTTISSGVLQIGDSTSTGSFGTGDIINNSSLIIKRTNDLTLSNLISGTGTLTKELSNTLTLTQNNTYSGNNTINGGLLVLQNNAPNPTSKTFIGTGQLRIESASASFTSAFSNSGWTFNSTLSGLTIGKSSNISDVTVANSTTIAGPISIYGGNINLNSNLTISSLNDPILVKASVNIISNASRTFQTNKGGIIFWSDADNSAGGYIQIGDNNTFNSTNGSTSSNLSGGGNIVLAGGLDNGSNGGTANDGIPDGFASSSTINGIRLGSSTNNTSLYYSGGGSVILRGNCSSTIAGDASIGLYHLGQMTINAGNGEINTVGNSSGSYGINFVNSNNNVTTTGNYLTLISNKSTGNAITISGTSTSSYGVVFNYNNPKEILATGGGDITINGTAGSLYGIFMSNVDVLASAGNTIINGGARGIRTLVGECALGAKSGSSILSSSSNIKLIGDVFAFDISTPILSTGTFTIEPFSNSFSSALTYPITNLTMPNTLTGLTIGKSTNTANITIGSATTVAGPINIFGGTVALNATLNAGTDNISIQASSALTQTAAITASGLVLNGTGTFTLTNTSNNFTTLAGGASGTLLGTVNIVDAANGLTIGTVGNNTGILSSGTITVETLASNLTLGANISTTNTSSNAVVLTAAKNTAIGVGSGGDIIISGTPTITMGAGGIAKLFSGLEITSIGLTSFVGGSTNVRNNVDETTATFSPVLNANTIYALYRKSSEVGDINIVTSGGDAVNSSWAYANGTIYATSTSANINVSEVQNYLSTSALTIIAENININSPISSTSLNSFSLRVSETIGTIFINKPISLAGPVSIFSGRVNIMDSFTLIGTTNLTINSTNIVVLGTTNIGGSVAINSSGNFILGTNLTAGSGYPFTATGGFSKSGSGTSYLFSNINTTNTAVTFSGPLITGNFNTSNPITKINSNGGNITISGAISAYSGTGMDYLALIYGNLYNAQGGTVTGSNTDIFIRFNTGNHKFVGLPAITAPYSIPYLVVAGGGGGGNSSSGNYSGGGGGGGGVVDGNYSFTGTPIALSVGSGGSISNSGGDSYIETIKTGGGGGGGNHQSTTGLNGTGGAGYAAGGGGGGAGSNTGGGRQGGSGTIRNGGWGSASGAVTNYGGSGGGAVGNGSGNNTGGSGYSSSITGTNVSYGNGGGAQASPAARTGGGGGAQHYGSGVGADGTIIFRFTLPNSSAINAASLSTSFHLNADTGAVNIGSTVDNISLLEITAGKASTVTGLISGTGGLLKTGTGTLTLSGDHRYSGGTTVSGGTLVLNDLAPMDGMGVIVGTLNINQNGTVQLTGLASALGYNANRVTTININGGTLEALAGQQHIWNLTGGLNFNGGGTLKTNGGTSDAAATSYFEWGVANISVTNPTSPAIIAGRIHLRNAYPSVFNVADGVADNDLLISAAITQSDANNFTKAGSGKLTFSGTNSYSGTTTINAGTLQIGNGGTTGSISTGGVTNNANLTFNRSNDFTFSNVISGNGTVTKLGTGIVTVSGSNTYSGNTTISQGVFRCGSVTALGTSAGTTVLDSGAALDLNGMNYSTLEPITISGTGISSGGAIFNSTTTAATFAGPITLAGNAKIDGKAADLTISGTINGAYPIEVTTSSKSYIQSGIVGGVTAPSSYSVNTGTGAITNNAAITVAGSIAMYGGNITINENLNTSSANANGSILLKSSGDISLSAAKSITTSGAPVIVWANSDNGATNGSISLRNGSSIITGSGSVSGGAIWLGGGSDSISWSGLTVGSGYAVPGTSFTPSNGGGAINCGIYLEQCSLSSFGGNIKILGDAAATSRGIITYGNTVAVNSGSGKIEIEGQVSSTATGNRDGILFGVHDLSRLSSINITSSAPNGDAIKITSIGRGSGDAIGLSGTLTITASGGGNIVVNGDAVGTGKSIFIGNYYHGILNVYANSGNISLNGNTKAIQVAAAVTNGSTTGPSKLNIGQGGTISSSTSNVFLTADNIAIAAGGIAVNTSGKVTLDPYSNSFSSAISYPISGLSMANTISGLTIGKVLNTSNISFTANQTVAGSISAYGGQISLGVGVNLTTTTSNGHITLLGTNGFITDANSGSTRGRIMTAGGNIEINADSDDNNTGLLDIDWLTIDGSTGNVSLEGANFVWSTASGVTFPEFYGTGALSIRSSSQSSMPINTTWIALFNTKSSLTLGHPSTNNTGGIDIVSCVNCNNTATNYSGKTLQVNGPISLYGQAIGVSQNLVANNSGIISLYGNTLTISPSNTISSTGNLIISPKSNTTTIGIGGAAGTLQLPASYFNTNFSDGFSNIQIGRDSQTGNITSNAFSLRDNITFLTSGSLTLGGKPVLGNNNITLGSAISSITASASNYFQTNGTGKVISTLTNNASRLFPVGNAFYNGVTISNKTNATDTFSVLIKDSVLGNGDTGRQITTPHVKATWDISKNNPNAGSGVDFDFNWSSSQEIGGISTFVLNHHNDTVWHIASGTTGTVAGTTTKSISHTGYTGRFSPFAFGNTATPLPVELKSFNAECNSDQVKVEWTTASEKNNERFELYKSSDAIEWTKIYTVKGQGTKATETNYTFNDFQKEKGYYRLKDIDYNGKEMESQIVFVDCKDETNQIQIYPNPASDYLKILSQSDEESILSIIDMNGKVVRNELLISKSTLINVKNLQSGFYYIEIKNKGIIERIKFLKQ